MIGMLSKFLARFLEALGRHATWILFGGILLGLVLPDLAALARPALAPTVALILAAALLRVDWAIMLAYARRPGVVLALAVWCMLVSPVVTWALVQVVPLPPGLSTAIVLMAAAPPILGATGLALVLGLDGALAAVAGLLSTVVTPLSVPPLALALLGLELEVGMAEFMLRLAVVIGAALALVLVVKRLCRPEQLRAQAGRIDGLFVLFMLIFAVGIMDGVTAVIVSDPGKAALWLGAAFVANPVLQVLGALAFAGLGRQRALTAGLLTGNCNMGILLAALPPDGNFDIVLYFALGQLPMFMLPALLTPGYRRLLAAPRR